MREINYLVSHSGERVEISHGLRVLLSISCGKTFAYRRSYDKGSMVRDPVAVISDLHASERIDVWSHIAEDCVAPPRVALVCYTLQD